MTRSFFFVFAAAIAGGANGKSFAVPRNIKALSVRGGAGPLDVTDTAKVATILSGVNAGMVVLSPSKTAEVYGVNLTPMSTMLMKRVGATLLSMAIMSYCLVFKSTSVNTAIGAAQIPWVVTVLGDLLNGETKDLGLPQGPQYLVGIINSFFAYVCLTDASYVDNAIKALVVWALLNGVTLGLATVPTLKPWGIENPDDLTIFFSKQLGFVLTGLGVFTLALSQGVDSLRAIGYSWIPLLANVVDAAFVSKDAEKLGLASTPIYVWMAMMVAFVATLAFD